jgi:hypothetical protein
MQEGKLERGGNYFYSYHLTRFTSCILVAAWIERGGTTFTLINSQGLPAVF